MDGLIMFAGKMKALTFSYDDGVLQDERLIRIFNKYNLKATFNLNSEKFGQEAKLSRCNKLLNHTKVDIQDVKKLYQGHEVAAHTLSHPNLCKLEKDEIIYQVVQDRLNLSQLVDAQQNAITHLMSKHGYINLNQRFTIWKLIRCLNWEKNL